MTTQASIVVFVIAGIAIAAGGTRLVRVVDELADRTGLGEAFLGMTLLGGLTSLSGSVLSVTAAIDGAPQLAVSNAIGGIAVQTLFLVVADATYRGVNLEHAAPSLPNLLSAATLVALLAFVLAAAVGPDLAVFEIHPASLVIFAGYLVGVRLVQQAKQSPWWTATTSDETREDVPDADRSTTRSAVLWAQVLVLGLMTGVAGWALAQAGQVLAAETPLSETFVGATFTATTTSLPELVTTMAAVRRGALTLAVGGIVGGNSFDVLMLPFADAAYRPGSLYATLDDSQLLVVSMTIAMTAVLLLGLLGRQRRAWLGVGAEGIVIVVLYVLTITAVALD